MLKLELDGSMWYGFDKESKHVAISHATLLQWARANNAYKEIDASTAIRLPDGTRLVRGPKMIKLAEEHSWGDIAMALGDELLYSIKL